MQLIFKRMTALKGARAFFVLLVLLAAASFFFPGLTRAEQAAPVPGQVLAREALQIVTARGSFDFVVEVAETPQERATGLMYRKSMAPNHGMLFDFHRNEPVSMWMKNTYVSLDMIFIGSDGRVKKIAARTTPHSTEIITSGEKVGYVLELKGGVAEHIGLKVGDLVRHRLTAK